MTTLPAIYNYTLPHELDRIGQQDAFEAVMRWYTGPKQYMILSAPTGIGKTGILAMMTRYVKTMALAGTKVLLDSVYAGDYNFEQLQGKGNHPCKVSPLTHRADVCALPEDMSKQDRYEECEGSGDCSYYIEYDKFCSSHKAVTTYAKFISDRRPYNNPSLYAFDEAHEVPEVVISRAGIDINTQNERSYPYLKGFSGLENSNDMGFEAGIAIMRQLYSTAMTNAPKQEKLWSEMTSREQIKFKRSVIRHRQFLKRIEESGKLMIKDEDTLNIWHYSSTRKGNFSARPMTAAYHFKNILDTGHNKTLLMSATISPHTAEMLGIKDNELEFYQAPQQYPVNYRRIWDLGQPGMGNTATNDNPSLWNIQALRMHNILSLRPDVSSVILTTSKVKANRIATTLRQYGHDIFTPPIGYGTDLQLRSWEDYRKPGAVCVSYNFWEGVSLDLDHMLFIAGIKYPDLGTAFEKARANRSWSEFNYRAAINVVQGSGRIQRGHLTDYLPIGGPDNLVGKMVFLVDGNWTRIASFAPGDFAERIVSWPN